MLCSKDGELQSMNWEAVGAIGELIGALVVVLTLVYLSKQIRDNSVQLKAGSVTDIAALFNDAFMPIYNDDHSRSIWIDGLNGTKELSEKDIAIFDLFMHRIVNPFEVVIAHYQKGILDELTYQGYTERIRAMCLETPGGKAWFSRNKELLSPLLLEYIETNTEAGT